MAQRLQREQPELRPYAAQVRFEHGDTVGETAVFYATLVWAMFDRGREATLPRLTQGNLTAAETVVAEAIAAADVGEKPVHERVAAPLVDRQPHIYAKLRELIEEDVREDAMSADTAAIIFKPVQVVLEALDAAVEGRRPGEQQGTIVHEQPKVSSPRQRPHGCSTTSSPPPRVSLHLPPDAPPLVLDVETALTTIRRMAELRSPDIERFCVHACLTRAGTTDNQGVAHGTPALITGLRELFSGFL